MKTRAVWPFLMSVSGREMVLQRYQSHRVFACVFPDTRLRLPAGRSDILSLALSVLETYWCVAGMASRSLGNLSSFLSSHIHSRAMWFDWHRYNGNAQPLCGCDMEPSLSRLTQALCDLRGLIGCLNN